MQRAGAASAAEIALRFRDRLGGGVLVFAGPGNNGGDAWVLAGALAASGVRVRVCEPVPAATDDARAERALAAPFVELVAGDDAALRGGDVYRGERVVVDGLLGTGSSGAPRGPIAAAIAGFKSMRERGAAIVALDLPSGVDATTGEATWVARATLTLTYGTLKRGHLTARAACGRIAVVDIGIGGVTNSANTPMLVTRSWVAERIPSFGANAHKGTRKKLAIVGGGDGMGGAALLAAQAAWRSGIGMVKVVASSDTLATVRETSPQTLTAPLPRSDADVARDITGWADVVVMGPGLGLGIAARDVVDRVMRGFPGPVVLDADALTAFGADVNALAKYIMDRPTIITPHLAEFGRLTGTSVDETERRRFEVAIPLAKHTRAVVLLKGQPTILTSPSGERLVSASGTPLLAAAGSGDLLAGIVGTLLAQTGDAFASAAVAAWVHGRAAWLVQRGRRTLRGLTLADVLEKLPAAWTLDATPTRSPILVELPDVVPVRA
jgi:hydroxyethylthiazole kinase-like uncharacterized protein yjeF